MKKIVDKLFYIVIAILVIYIISPIDFLPGIEFDDTLVSLGALALMYAKIKRIIK